MKQAHNINISVFCKEGEDTELIKGKLIGLVPFNMEEKKLVVKESRATGFNHKEIKIFEIELKKDHLINEFLDGLNKKLSVEQKELLLRQVSSRLDDELRFFIRIDKKKWFEDELVITDSGDCFHIKIAVAAFPAKVENAILILRQIFK